MSTATRYGARQYLRDLPGIVRTIRDELREGAHNARTAALYLLPFEWRVEADRRCEEYGFEMFHEGHERGLAGDPVQPRRSRTEPLHTV